MWCPLCLSSSQHILLWWARGSAYGLHTCTLGDNRQLSQSLSFQHVSWVVCYGNTHWCADSCNTDIDMMVTLTLVTLFSNHTPVEREKWSLNETYSQIQSGTVLSYCGIVSYYLEWSEYIWAVKALSRSTCIFLCFWLEVIIWNLNSLTLLCCNEWKLNHWTAERLRGSWAIAVSWATSIGAVNVAIWGLHVGRQFPVLLSSDQGPYAQSLSE